MSRRIESRELIRRNVGPGGFYDLYKVKYSDTAFPEKVFVLNERGREFLKRLRERVRESKGRDES